LDGDGAAIMHLGGLTTTGVLGPPNFLHIVLNNGTHESVGGQPTVGFNVNLTAIAESSGYKTVGLPVEAEQNLRAALMQLLAGGGPAFVDVRIRKGLRKDLPPLKISSHIDLKNLFTYELQQPCIKK
jgi:phosphonopyruvate decarboxylase